MVSFCMENMKLVYKKLYQPILGTNLYKWAKCESSFQYQTYCKMMFYELPGLYKHFSIEKYFNTFLQAPSFMWCATSSTYHQNESPMLMRFWQSLKVIVHYFAKKYKGSRVHRKRRGVWQEGFLLCAKTQTQRLVRSSEGSSCAFGTGDALLCLKMLVDYERAVQQQQDRLRRFFAKESEKFFLYSAGCGRLLCYNTLSGVALHKIL